MSDRTALRIISLLPGATELLAALGLTRALVGRSHECDYPPEILNLPVCTEARLHSDKSSAEIDADVLALLQNALSIYNLKTEVIEQLQPTHILTQDRCEVCAVSLQQVEQILGQLTGKKPQVISLQPETLSDVWQDIERVAEVFGVSAQPALNSLQARVQFCQQKLAAVAKDRQPTVAAIEWIDPLMAAGSWIPELIALAGGRCLFGATGQNSPYLPWEALQKADPEFMIIMPCGFDRDRTRQESQVLLQHPGWSNLQAVQHRRVCVTDGNAYFNRPGPRLADSLEILAEILHPDLFEFGYRRRGWEYFD